MITVGIDLSAEPKGTAIAALRWVAGEALVGTLHVGSPDALVLHWMNNLEGNVGIDCPFGWPVAFVDLVTSHPTRTLEVPPELPPGWRREYVLRHTDRWVQDTFGLVPLSVAADRIGHTAVRLAALRANLEPRVSAPLDGSGALAEVYPAAALKVWGLPFRGYKGVNSQARHELVDQLMRAAPWLKLGDHEATVRGSDDALDAVICALVARAVALGATYPPVDAAAARAEGWIHVPAGTLAQLAGTPTETRGTYS